MMANSTQKTEERPPEELKHGNYNCIIAKLLITS